MPVSKPPLGAPPRNMGFSGEPAHHPASNPLNDGAYAGPGARREKLRRRDYRRGQGNAVLPYAELRTASAFSFLAGASLPEDLIARAAEIGLSSVALIDRAGVYGAPRFYKAAKEGGIRARVGAEVVLDDGRPAKKPGDRPTRFEMPRLTLLVESRQGYRNLCRLLTEAARGHAKGDARATWAMVEEFAGGLHCLTGGDEGLFARALVERGLDSARTVLDRLLGVFPGRVHGELQRHGRREEEERNRALIHVADSLRLPFVATNGVRYARRDDKHLQDVMTAIRHRTTLDAGGTLLELESERHLKSAAEMGQIFADRPDALVAAAELSERLDFTLADLGYRFPDFPLPDGCETPGSYLRQLTWDGARARFRPLTAKAQRQIERELHLIEKLELAGYFLIVWDIVRFCKERGILAQGRGSAANSAVCYALSITAVDPVKMELLFERFLSEERGEWPDIDLDLPSGDQRESVIQYVYRRYGSAGGSGAAMTANVITYRDRSAARETAKALGFSAEQVDSLSKRLGSWGYDRMRGDPKTLHAELAAAGLDPNEPRVRLFGEMWLRLQNLPRHLGQHSGGMVIAAGRLDEVVPLEPAAMPGRVVVQWDKDDCADLGLIKVDLLGLGMLQAIEQMLPMIRTHEGKDVDLAHLPADDPKVYKMLREADTVGIFQVESRAQMASLPRHAPTKFYDLVIQVAIIRPGPIMGGMIHPFFERRMGREKVEYAHPSLEPILKRTLGVPIFQEQLLRMAMTVAGFTGGEAEELRRAMGFKRSIERMHSIEERLRRGMTERGITGQAQEQIVQSITSFALYGFPESHAASFALIAYASAWLRCYHPTAFYAALLNAWPMGFYHPATLVKDAERHGVEVRPVDVNHSQWDCTWEANGTGGVIGGGGASGAVRIGLRYVRGLRKQSGEGVARARQRNAFRDVDDFVRRSALHQDEVAALAEVGALASLGLTRRAALWQSAQAVRTAGQLFNGPDERRANEPSPLPEMTRLEETFADFHGAGLTTGAHPMAYARPGLNRRGVVTAAELPRVESGRRVRTAGSVIVRQRPGTAKGMLFLTLEDETGMSQAIVTPDLFRENRTTIVGNAGLIVEGVLQKRDGSVSVKAERFWPIRDFAETPSHDFR
ncbi:MAG: error-prone DNA polymerase [Acidobacteriota bacterium]